MFAFCNPKANHVHFVWVLNFTQGDAIHTHTNTVQVLSLSCTSVCAWCLKEKRSIHSQSTQLWFPEPFKKSASQPAVLLVALKWWTASSTTQPTAPSWHPVLELSTWFRETAPRVTVQPPGGFQSAVQRENLPGPRHRQTLKMKFVGNQRLPPPTLFFPSLTDN